MAAEHVTSQAQVGIPATLTPSGDVAVRRFDVYPVSIAFLIHRQATPRWAIQNLRHNGLVGLVYAVGGKAHYSCRDERRLISAGDMMLFDDGVVHSGAADAESPWHFYAVLFQIATVERGDRESLESIASLPWHVVAENRVAVEALFAELDSRWVAKEAGHEVRCRAILLTLLHMYIESATKREHREPHAEQIIRISRYLQNNYTRNFPVRELSARAGISESRFRLLFRRVMGTSVVRYQNTLRINRARSLLLSGEHSVSEAARLVGIEDVYYFSRMFKKYTGLNPSSLVPK